MKRKFTEVTDFITRYVLLALLLLTAYQTVTAERTLYIDGVDVSQKSVYEGDINDFLVVATRFAETHTYNKETYNCANYTNDLKYITDQLGIKTKKVTGCPAEDNSTCHTYLRLSVDFEPQTARFTDYSKLYPLER
jgi:hypothetical protein